VSSGELQSYISYKNGSYGATHYVKYYITINTSGWHIFGPDEDVPIEFQTADGYVSNN
jgi:hypothetical protein